MSNHPANSEVNQRWGFFKMHYLNKNEDKYDEKLSAAIDKVLEEHEDLIEDTGLTESQVDAVATIVGSAMREMILGLIGDYQAYVHGPSINIGK